MKLFRAIFKVSNIETCRGHEIYQAAPASESSQPEFERVGGRASEAFGDMKGWAELTQDDLAAGEDFENIVFVTGGKAKEFMISAEPTVDPAERAALERLLKAQLDKVFSEELPHSPRRYRIHSDKPSIHIQAMAVPLDEDGNPIDIRPAFLRKLQNFAGAEGLLPGRGSTDFRRLPATPAKGEKHAMEVAEVRSKSKRAREAKLNELREMRKSLNQLIHLRRAKLRTHNKNGSPTSHPSVTFDGTTFRREWLLREGHTDIIRMMDRVDHHRGTYDPARVVTNRRVKCEKLEALFDEGALEKISPRQVAKRLEADGWLSFVRSFKGTELDDPALKFEGCRMRESTLRREGRHKIADLLRDDGAGSPSGRSAIDRQPIAPAPQKLLSTAPEPIEANLAELPPAPLTPCQSKTTAKGSKNPLLPPIPILTTEADDYWLGKPGIISINVDLDTAEHLAPPSEIFRTFAKQERPVAFRAWLDGAILGDVEPERRKWILGQLSRIREAKALIGLLINQPFGAILIGLAFDVAVEPGEQSQTQDVLYDPNEMVLQFGENYGRALRQIDSVYLDWLVVSHRKKSDPVPVTVAEAAAKLRKERSKDPKNKEPGDPEQDKHRKMTEKRKPKIDGDKDEPQI